MDRRLYEEIKRGSATSAGAAVTAFKDQIDNDAQRTLNNNTVLHVAATFGRGETATKILQLCPSLLTRANTKGETALHIAAKGGHLHAVQALLECAKRLGGGGGESGISLEKEMLRMSDNVDDTALHMAVRNRHVEIVNILVGEDCEFPFPANQGGETPLYLAAECGHESSLQKMVTTCTSPAYSGPYGRNPLHAAAIFNYQGCVRLLLNWKQDLVEEEDEEGWTPLHHAAKKGNVEAIRQILRFNKTAAYRRTGRQDDGGNGGWTTAVHIAASHGHSQVLKEIFSHCPDCCEMVNSKSQNFLHVTILNNESRTLKFGLADRNFEHLIDEKDRDGNTPLHLLAASRCHPRNLIAHPRANKRTYNNENFTPLDIVYTDKYILDRAPFIKYKLKKVGFLGNRQEVKERQDSPEVQKKIKEQKQLAEMHLIVATLVATVTFAAGFTLPGGYNSSSPGAGMAILSRERAFQAFVITNTIALMCSTSAVFLYFSAFYLETYQEIFYQYDLASGLVFMALGSMVLAFVTGAYVVLSNTIGLAITVCLIGFSSALMYFCWLVKTAKKWSTQKDGDPCYSSSNLNLLLSWFEPVRSSMDNLDWFNSL
ncbi:PREDICTED: protein ACCELERATED CELL DEATH 6-like [Ipomoea nil]|uniref:protein ACCELERATED CELL DEATH 6-like n=1 Tax=Ipomoea nil TaxID=35883 RepID=UPI000901BCCE|nr:PREDICTED: protein ACCELERATED CELL DEATH 6-like [Ipomoea nil]